MGLIYFSDSYILIIFCRLPYDQSCVSSHSCLDTPSLSADKLPKDEFNFVRILELYLQGGFLPPEYPWSKFVTLNILQQIVNFGYGASKEKKG